MNLTKLFNFKFMKQMLKKSKGQLVLFLGLVPILTFFMLMSVYSGDAVDVVYPETISLLNFIGMYVIPIILSINLFNYIYKRSSVDFINAMPMSKKTIFISNSILGIVLIILMQLINVLGIFVFSLLKPEITIFSGIVWDTFLTATLSYIFVFTVTNLAMCLSGNVVTQIVVTCVIAFLIPFTVNNFSENFLSMKTGNFELHTVENVTRETEVNMTDIIDLVRVNEYHETMPYRLIKIAFDYNEFYFYDNISNIKMLLLSIIYISLGGALFKKRKFEDVGESFNSVKVHELVKALTMFPMFALFNKIDIFEMNIEFIIFVYVVLLVYFFVYDVITNKKLSLKTSIIYILIIFISLNVITIGIEKVVEKQEPKVYTLNDVESIAINMDGMREYESDILDYRITDRKLIETIIDYSYYFVSTIKVNLTDGNELYIDKNYVMTDSKINEDGSKLKYENFVEMIYQDEGYTEKLKEIKLEKGKYTFNNEIPIKGDLLEKVDKYVTEYQKNNVNIEEDITSDSEIFVVKKFIYKNHRLTYEPYRIKDEDILRDIVEYTNKYFIEKIKDIEPDEFSSYTIKNYNRGYNVYLYKESNKLLDIIRNDKTEIDFNKEYVTVYKYDTNADLYYISGNEDLIKLYYEELANIDPGESEVKYYYNNQDVMVEVRDNYNDTEIEIENVVTNEVINTVSKD